MRVVEAGDWFPYSEEHITGKEMCVGKNMPFSRPVVRVEAIWDHTKLEKGFIVDPGATMFRKGKVSDFAKDSVVTVRNGPLDAGHPGARLKENVPGRSVFWFNMVVLQNEFIRLAQIRLTGYIRDKGEAVFKPLPNMEVRLVDDETNVKIYGHTFRENKRHPIQGVNLADSTWSRAKTAKMMEQSGVKKSPAPEWFFEIAE